MPLFATLVAAAINGLTSFYALVLTYEAAITWARRTFILAIVTAFFLAVSACVQLLLSAVANAALPTRFVMGLGMFIPSNAVAVMSCLASVWLACVMVRLKIDGLRW